jgi:hypothetical protein
VVAGRAVRSLAHGLAPPRHRRSPRSRSCRGRTYAGLRVKSVTIRPGHSHSGLARIDRLGRTTAEKQILITLAGPYAQRRFAPHSGWRSRNQSHLNSGYDFDSVAVLIDNEHGNGRVADLYSRYVNAKAEQLVEVCWQQIETVANALLERGTLIGAECRKRWAMRRRRPEPSNLHVQPLQHHDEPKPRSSLCSA